MSRITKQDTDGSKPLLGKGELGYDAYPAGGDEGRVYVGTGAENKALMDKESFDNHSHGASNTSFTPSGNIEATDVQTAIVELDTEKEPADNTILKDADIGVSIEAHDATILKGGDIGSSVQAYDVDTAKTDVQQTFTKAQSGAVVVANTAAYNLALANEFKSTLAGVVTITFTGITDGQSGNIRFDNSGGYVVGVSVSGVALSAVALAKLSVAGKYVIGYVCDGTDVILTVSDAVTTGGV